MCFQFVELTLLIATIVFLYQSLQEIRNMDACHFDFRFYLIISSSNYFCLQLIVLLSITLQKYGILAYFSLFICLPLMTTYNTIGTIELLKISWIPYFQGKSEYIFVANECIYNNFFFILLMAYSALNFLQSIAISLITLVFLYRIIWFLKSTNQNALQYYWF